MQTAHLDSFNTNFRLFVHLHSFWQARGDLAECHHRVLWPPHSFQCSPCGKPSKKTKINYSNEQCALCYGRRTYIFQAPSTFMSNPPKAPFFWKQIMRLATLEKCSRQKDYQVPHILIDWIRHGLSIAILRFGIVSLIASEDSLLFDPVYLWFERY